MRIPGRKFRRLQLRDRLAELLLRVPTIGWAALAFGFAISVLAWLFPAASSLASNLAVSGAFSTLTGAVAIAHRNRTQERLPLMEDGRDACIAVGKLAARWGRAATERGALGAYPREIDISHIRWDAFRRLGSTVRVAGDLAQENVEAAARIYGEIIERCTGMPEVDRFRELGEMENIEKLGSVPALLNSAYLLLRESLKDATVPYHWRRQAEEVFDRIDLGNDSEDFEEVASPLIPTVDPTRRGNRALKGRP
jgi:hypothetical protein